MTEKQIRNSFLELAKTYLGYSETNGGHRKIVDIYNNHRPLAVGYTVKYTDEWCATYVSAMSIKAGLTDIIPTECSCQRQIALFKELGRWQEDENYTPKKGDIIYYDWDDDGKGDCKGWADHVGIVESVNSRVIKVLEGNRKNAVGYRQIAVNAKTIRGYAIPDYASKATEEKYALTRILKKKAILMKGDDVKEVQQKLISLGYSCGKSGADGKYGKDTEKAVRAVQKAKGIEADGIVGKDTAAKLGFAWKPAK